MNRVAEAYFYGIGVEQSDKQVSIWSKVIENIYPILHQSAINNNNTNIQKLSFDKTNYIRILLNNPNKNKPEQESLLNELNKNGMLQKTILPRVSVSQQISSQKKINELMTQIQSDYTNWLETRDQDSPKP